MPSLDEIGIKYINGHSLEKGKQYCGGDKTAMGQGFTKRYEELFSKWRDEPINLLELGVLRGLSLAMWAEYFSKGHIYGVDINLSIYRGAESELRRLGAFDNENITTYESDVTEPEFQELISGLPAFDIIIDDALHNPQPQLDNFLLLFPRLNSGGIYVVEDLLKPVAVLTKFMEILAGVSNRNHKFVSKSRYASLIRSIKSVEIRHNNLIFFKH